MHSEDPSIIRANRRSGAYGATMILPPQCHQFNSRQKAYYVNKGSRKLFFFCIFAREKIRVQ